MVKALERIVEGQASQTQLINSQLQELSSLKEQGDLQFKLDGKLIGIWSCTMPPVVIVKERKLMLADMWSHVKQHTFPLGADGRRKVVSRLMCVTDISPIVATILLASTPK